MSRISKFIAAFLIPFTAFGAPFGGMPFAYWQKISTGPVSITTSYFMIGGGASGGCRVGGGGGAGGVLSGSSLTLNTGTTYTVTVGAGGTAVTDSPGYGVAGNNGGNTIISGSGITTLNAVGGGGGGDYTNIAAITGGSGGGAGGFNSSPYDTGASGTSGQGYNGGSAVGVGGSGGGGGAGSAGSNAPDTNTGGNGGNGVATTILGQSITFGGGGGGVDGYTGTGGTGGTGGGGNGGMDSNGSSGYTNYGAGGGGARDQSDTGGFTSGYGGSGTAILSYPTTYSATFTGTPVIGLNGSNYFYQFFQNGTITPSTSAGKYTPKFSNVGTSNFIRPTSIAVDSSNNIYFCAYYTHAIYKTTSSGTTSVFYNGSYVSSNYFTGIAVDSSGNVYVGGVLESNIYKFNSSGTYVTTYTTATGGNCSSNIAIDSSNNIYFVDGGNNYVVKISSSGTVTNNYASSNNTSGYVALDSSNNLYVTTVNGDIYKYNSSGTQQYHATISGFFSYLTCIPSVDSSGNLWVATGSTGGNPTGNAYVTAPIYKVNSSGTVTTYNLPVLGSNYSNQNQGNVFAFSAVDSANNVYFYDQYSQTVYVTNNSGSEIAAYRINSSGLNGCIINAGGIIEGVGQTDTSSTTQTYVFQISH